MKYIVNDFIFFFNFLVVVFMLENCDMWVSMCYVLEVILGNKEVFKLIDGVIFVLCLDDYEVNSIVDVIRMFLYGDGKNR